MTREYTDEMHEFFNKTWSDAYFDIMTGVFDQFPDWSKEDQIDMIYTIIEQLARRVGVIEDDDCEDE